MARLPILYLVFGLVGLSISQICPPAEVLYPCTCPQNIGWTMITCVNILGPFDLKDTLDKASEYVSEDFVFDELNIYNTSISQFDNGTIGYLRFGSIEIVNNRNLEYIAPAAFNGTANSTIYMLIALNNLRNAEPWERDFFDFISSFQKLETLIARFNNLTSIPDHAFGGSPSLTSVDFGSNNISRIGSQAFSPGAASLRKITMSHNPLSLTGIAKDAFDGVGANLERLEMKCNYMYFLDQETFQTTLDQVRYMTVSGSNCPLYDGGWQYFHCDERMDWVCDDAERYSLKLLYSIQCKTEFGPYLLWDYCEEMRNNTAGLV